MPPSAARLEAGNVKQETSGAVTRRTSLPPEMETPPTLFDAQWEKYGGFDLDPCCQVTDPTAQRVLRGGGSICVTTEEAARLGSVVHPSGVVPMLRGAGRIQVDGLVQPWHGTVWMNPPYDRTLKLWVEKAVSEVHCGNAKRVVALLPSSTGSPWWQEHILTSLMGGSSRSEGWAPDLADVKFLPGRQRFSWKGEPMKYTARFASVIVVWEK